MCPTHLINGLFFCHIADNKQQTKADDAKRRSWCLSSLVCEFENCLQEALSDVLKAEMKAAYEDLWLEVNTCFGKSCYVQLRLCSNYYLYQKCITDFTQPL